ncbi:MAG: hypothetical protein GQ582_12045 [Methyloprofundus sp.]|nr:hypothetical protein [Methyloprofundus sp.]
MKPLLFALALSPIAMTNTAAAAICPQGSAVYTLQNEQLALPRIGVESNESLWTASLEQLAGEQDFQFKVTGLSALESVSAPAGTIYHPQQQVLAIDELCLRQESGIKQNEQLFKNTELQLIPNTQPLQFLLKSIADQTGKTIFTWAIANDNGGIFLKDRAAFDRLAIQTDISGVLGVRELKFVMVGLQSGNSVLYFMNSQRTPLHYDFVRHVLNRYQQSTYSQGAARFSAETYFTQDRDYLVGSIIAYDYFNQGEGLYSLEFWPTDPVPAALIEQAYHTATAALPFLASPLAYHPVGNTHELEYQAFAERFAAANIRTITSDELFAQLDTTILNKGEAYGRLKVINAGDPNPGQADIAIYTFIPNTLGHVGGIITAEPQTPLSHINLKARQNNTPNAYIKEIHNNPEYSELINQWVHYTVSDTGIALSAATEAEALTWLAGQIPTEVTIPESDLSLTDPMPLTELGHSDWVRVGVKAANVAELGKILAGDVAPKGYALPFALYDQFMSLQRCADDLSKLCQDQNSLSLYQYVAQFLSNETVQQNQAQREQFLAELREIIEQAEAPQALIDKIETVRLFWEPAGEPFTQKLRVRSSTNNEDLEGFNGAGLYDSYTHKPKEGLLIKSIKEVWASLWTDRAFDERRIHRIEHLKTYMGVLIHPNYGDEQVNGVAITKNIYNPHWDGFYVNAQYGEISISNPEPIETETGLLNPIADEFIISRLPASLNAYAWETQFIRHSNIETVYDLPVMTEDVLTATEIETLRDNLQIIHQHFKTVYQGDENFAIDIEFKITETEDGSRGKLAIKQARPWVD